MNVHLSWVQKLGAKLDKFSRRAKSLFLFQSFFFFFFFTLIFLLSLFLFFSIFSHISSSLFHLFSLPHYSRFFSKNFLVESLWGGTLPPSPCLLRHWQKCRIDGTLQICYKAIKVSYIHMYVHDSPNIINSVQGGTALPTCTMYPKLAFCAQ